MNFSRTTLIALRLILGICSLGLFAECSRQAPPGGPPHGPLSPLNYTMHLSSQRDGDCGPEGSGCVRVTVRYPEFSPLTGLRTPDSLNEAIKSYILRSAEEKGPAPDSISALSEQFINAYRDRQRVFPGRWFWTLDRSVSVARDSAGIVTLEMREYVFSGGAHPSESLVFANFDKRTGMRLHLSDVIFPDRTADLTTAAEAAFRKVRNLEPGSSFLSHGFTFNDNVFRLNDDFFPSGDTLIVHFNTYEVAPYAMGPTTLRISLREFGGIVPRE
jgi:hypothetical protein